MQIFPNSNINNIPNIIEINGPGIHFQQMMRSSSGIPNIFQQPNDPMNRNIQEITIIPIKRNLGGPGSPFSRSFPLMRPIGMFNGKF